MSVLGCILLSFHHSLGQQAAPSIASIQSLIRARQIDEALLQINALLKISPKDIRLWTLDGIALSIKGKTQEAIVAFDKALAISPDFPAALQGEVQLYYLTKDKKAVPLLEKLVTANPKDVTAQEMLATMQARQGDCDAADTHFLLSEDAVENHPTSLRAYGNCLIQTKHYEQAVGVFKQLASLLPKPTFPRYNLAVALFESQQNDEAIGVLKVLMVDDPADPEILSLASDAYEKAGETPKAVSLLRQAIILDPTNTSYYNSFAAICLDHESFQAGIDMIDAGMQRVPTDSSLYISRGMLFAQLAQYDKAELDFKKAESLDSGQSLSLYALDLAELQKNDPKTALAQVHAQLKIHPESALLHYLLAKVLSTQGADTDSKVFDETTREAEAALKLNPNLTEARDLLATMYSHSGQYALAVEQCRLALKSNPRDQTAIYHLITALRHTGQPDQPTEIKDLVKQLAELQKASRQNETDRKRFRFEASQTPTP